MTNSEPISILETVLSKLISRYFSLEVFITIPHSGLGSGSHLFFTT